MTPFGLLASLALYIVGSQAAPTPENIALAQKYAPQWRFHPSEIYWPSTVEYFLSGIRQVDGSGNIVNGAVTTSNVDDASGQGSGLYLSVDSIESKKANFLRGQNPSSSSPLAYTFIAPKSNGVVDLFYWLFTPFNQAKSVPLLGQIGDHVGDWERMTVRTVNGVATTVDYHAHGDTGSGTLPWAQVVKFDNNQRPVGYVAQGSHGFWATPGTFTYVDAVIFKLQDVTADNGVYWDIRNSLVNFAYPESYSGNLDWLNYKGAWGNIGETDCWWHFIYDECEVVSGPGGPLRDDVLGAAKAIRRTAGSMDGPLSQVIGTTTDADVSSITVHVDPSVTGFATENTYDLLAIQVTCSSTVTAPVAANETAATSTTTGTIELTDTLQYTIEPAACAEGSVVKSYTIGLCADSTLEDCVWSASSRALRAFSADASILGVQEVKSISAIDLDNWSW